MDSIAPTPLHNHLLAQLPDMVSTSLGATNGILVKNAAALERATKLNVMVFDKTGTLTVGQPEVNEIVTAEGIAEDAVLTAAAAVEQGSAHPLAQAILRRAAKLKIAPPTRFQSLDGMGARAEPGYNVIAFPLAAGVLYPFVLSPEVAALPMSGSTLIVAINALMLKRTKFDGIRQAGLAGTGKANSRALANGEPAHAEAPSPQ